MKILHAFDMFTPYGGGIVTVIRDVACGLAAKGHQVVIYASDYQQDRHFIESLPSGIEVRLFPCKCNLFNFYYMPALRKEARRHLKEFDIIHLQTYRSYQNLILRKEAIAQGVPYVLDTHGTLPRTIGGQMSAVWLLKYFFDIATGMNILHDAGKVIAHSSAAINEYHNFGVPREKTVVVKPPFDTREYLSLPSPGAFRRSYNIHEKYIVLSLGRIHRIKGLNFLVESFRKLIDSRDDIILVIAGNDDGYLKELKGLVRNTGLTQKVIFTGFLQGNDKLSAMVDADVFVQPSLYEYNSRVVYESALCGTPVIISSGTMSSENIENIDGGYLFEYGNHADLTAKINHVLDNPTEAVEKTMKAAAYIRDDLSLEKVAQQYEQLYLDVISLHKRQTRNSQVQ